MYWFAQVRLRELEARQARWQAMADQRDLDMGGSVPASWRPDVIHPVDDADPQRYDGPVRTLWDYLLED